MIDSVRLKGPQFIGVDDPKLRLIHGRKSQAQRQAWWDAHVARWRVVAVCSTCGEDLILEELVAHRLNHVEDALRPLSRLVARQPRDQRLKLMALYCDTCGALRGSEPCECV
jgi:hypothetical protein